MEEQIKKLEKREDGFIEVTLKRLKDFDEYVFAQLCKDPSCLLCIRDPKNRTKLFYDSKGYLDLQTYLKGHLFEKEELLEFLMYLFEHLIQANTQKPVYLQSDLIFLSYDAGILKFLALPLTMDKWIFQSEQSKSFLRELVEEVRSREGYACIGLLVEGIKKKEIAFPALLQELLHLQGQQKKKMPWYARWLPTQQKEVFQVLGLPKPQPLLPPALPESIFMETMVLFGSEFTPCFMNTLSLQRYPMTSESFTIGRSKENDLCLTDQFISLKHATFYPQTGILLDHDSSNGTFVNQERIQQAALKHGDRVSFAQQEFTYLHQEEVMK